MLLELVSGYDRKGKETGVYRNPKDVAEMVSHCNSKAHIWIVCNDGKARQCKVNGKVRTWKTDPRRIEVPLKYGLREYTTFDVTDIGRVLIPVACTCGEGNSLKLGHCTGCDLRQ